MGPGSPATGEYAGATVRPMRLIFHLRPKRGRWIQSNPSAVRCTMRGSETGTHTRTSQMTFSKLQSPVAATVLLVAAGAIIGCSKGGTSSSAGMSGSTPDSGAMASSSTAPSRLTPVRGTIASVSDSMLTVSSDSGVVKVAIAAPLDVYSRVPAQLSDVKESSFVGVTSVAQPDGSQRATEIHIFPEKLRGT